MRPRSTHTGFLSLLVLLLVIALSGCGDGATSQDQDTTSSTAIDTSSTLAGGPSSTQATTASTEASTSSTQEPTAGTQVSGSGGLTVGATEGPYYVTNAPELQNGDLNYARLPGEPIRVSGHVYAGAADSSPLAGARIELWHADDSGAYHPNGNGDASDYPADEIALRGYVLTDAEGYYEFTSIYPGEYRGRCRHIHAGASAEAYGSVFTQMIVPAKPGDQTTPETDQIARSLPAANDLTFTAADGLQEATFDFYLAGD